MTTRGPRAISNRLSFHCSSGSVDYERTPIAGDSLLLYDRSIVSLVNGFAAMDEDAFSLPAWIYHDPEFFELEKQTIFRTGLAARVPSERYSEGRRLPLVRFPRRIGDRRCAARTGRSAASIMSAAIARRACSTAPRATAAGASPAPIMPGPTRSTVASSASLSARPSAASTCRRHGLVAARAGNLHGLHLRALRAGPAERPGDGGAVRARARGLSHGRAGAAGPRHAAPAAA